MLLWENQLPIRIRRNRRAKRMILRLSPCGRELRITIPNRVSDKKALTFISSQYKWLKEQIASSAQPVYFTPNTVVPLFGQDCLLLHNKEQRGALYTGDKLVIGGNIEHFPRRVRDWIFNRAKQNFSETALSLADKIDCQPAAITIRDNASRWGSCSRKRRINLNWRLAFAPTIIAHYVIAHEVAHLRHFNHSADFWQLVSILSPDYKEAKQWLKANGRQLYRFGQA